MTKFGLSTRFLPAFTILMSMPLLLSWNLKFGPFPTGPLYATLWSWSLLSYFLVPVLLAIEAVLVGRSVLRSHRPLRNQRFHVLAISIAAIGEILAIVVSRLKG